MKNWENLTLDDLLSLYDERGGSFIRSRQNHDKTFRNSFDRIKNDLGIDTNIATHKMIFDIRNPKANKTCVVCEKDTSFNVKKMKYNDFCSASCSCKSRTGAGTRPKQSESLKKLFGSKRGNETRRKISAKSKIYHSSDKGKADNKRRGLILQEKIKNGEWTPCITNTWTHWTTEVYGKKFRSTFEGIVYAYYRDKLSIELEFEKIRIPYILSGKRKIYIVDFVDHQNKVVIEVKPSTLKNDPKNTAKFQALETWCEKNKYIMRVIDEAEISKMALELDTLDFAIGIVEKYKWKK